MLFQYTYPHNHRLELLNSHVLEFINNLININARSQFRINRLFNDELASVVNISPALETKFKNFFVAFKRLSTPNKQEFIDIVNSAQNIEDSYEDVTCSCLEYKSDRFRQILGNNSFKELGTQLYLSLKAERWGIKDHYTKIYRAMPHKVCPFCGVEIMHKSFREDYDHLAPQSKYPVLTINVKNLAPMCSTCNKKFKKEEDVFYDDNGQRRPFIYPYSNSIDINFDYSHSIIPHTDPNHPDGTWNIEINPNNDSTRNWNTTFGIKQRYVEDYIDPNFDIWIEEFIDSCIDSEIDISTADALTNELSIYSRRCLRRKFLNTNIIKGPIFNFLENCNNQIFYNSVIRMYNRKMRNAA